MSRIYNGVMLVELESLGSSRGIRIPEPLIEECGLGRMVDLRVVMGNLVIAPDRKPRDGWAAAFERAGSSANDEILLAELPPNRFDEDEWRW